MIAKFIFPAHGGNICIIYSQRKKYGSASLPGRHTPVLLVISGRLRLSRDGKVVTMYYFEDKLKPERYVAASIWQP